MLTPGNDRISEPAVSLSGSLLLALPGMPDGNFRRTVILLSAHSEEGALGLVINRPTGLTIAGLQPEFEGGPLADVPVFQGGPVQPDRLILAAWQILPEAGTFKLFFGIDPARALDLQQNHEQVEVRAYQGYAGWSKGQLESELAREDWLVAQVNPAALANHRAVELWKELVGSVSPRMRLLTEFPDDPTVN